MLHFILWILKMYQYCKQETIACYYETESETVELIKIIFHCMMNENESLRVSCSISVFVKERQKMNWSEDYSLAP